MSGKKYKLTYFNTAGLAESIRYLLAYSKADFEDNRVNREDWPAMKSSTPFEQLPLLEFDDVKAYQSTAICRYLAKQYGLSGKNDIEQLKVDAIVDTLTDLRLKYVGFFREQDAATKEKLLEEIKQTHNPFYLAKLEEIVQNNGGYFVGGALTWADIFFTAMIELVEFITKEDPTKSYPALTSLKNKVFNLPGIKEYREKRPPA